ncbi:hypothetical protein C8P68_104242 [Mucilaginibacter yixingensis]|uniref:Uncharacterized protein n=1 Tax=Mucilaginibacter yixingensis TaxID=1295612 RepID=A0A2T5J9J7_9SPHI|nr:hypothetical protein [Mucilaginibacter yixingensis]PTQ96753.1 hypothetical protein C8P68_104242 [Mucilaginibacter yixingensis]
MVKKLLINLIKTCLLCFVCCTVFAMLYWFTFSFSIIRIMFMLSLIVGIMSLPVFFLTLPGYSKNVNTRMLIYFMGPVLYVLAALVSRDGHDRLTHLYPGLIFLIFHIWFYHQTFGTKAGKRR